MISSILHYSTLDLRFLDANLKQLSKFSNEIIIPICTHFFNGENEDIDKLRLTKNIISKYEKAKVKIFNWDGIKDNPCYYNNFSRKIGTELSTNKWLFFVDTDEIVDDSFLNWVDTALDQNFTYWLTSYWYFRSPMYQAKTQEAQGLLIKRENCNWDVNARTEREQALTGSNVIHGYHQKLLSKEGTPMIHHFSWVRTKEEMLKKVKNWSHCHDRNWSSLVEEEFSRPFNNTDFVHGYEYNIVDNKFNIVL
jgi:hypothetical protein